MSKVLVITPTYNERESLPGTVGRLRQALPEVDVLIADDNSPDGTGQIADDLAANDSNIHVLHRQGKEGLGAAYIAGFRWGMERGYDVLVEMDADGSHQPEQLHRLLDALEDGADLVLGSRWVPGGATENWPVSRQLLSRGGSLYSRILLGVPTRDITGGFRAYRKEVLENINLETIASQGYCFQIDLALRTLEAGYVVKEVPITFVERAQGVSKMSGNIVREAVVRVASWGAQRRAKQVKKLIGK